MDKNYRNDWENLLDYLSSLVNSPHIPKLDLKPVSILSSIEYKPEYDDFLKKSLQIVAKLVKKFTKDVSLCVDLCRVFFTIVSLKWSDEMRRFIFREQGSSHEFASLLNEFDDEHIPLLYIGVMVFIINSKLHFEDEILKAIHLKSLTEVGRLLLNVENVDIVVCWADVWVTLLLKNETKRGRLQKDYLNVLKSIFSVIIAYWNHCLVHRSRIDPIVSKCFKFEYESLRNKSSLGSIRDLMIFQYITDTSWQVPFKYFLCRHLFCFAVSQDLLVEVINVMKEELSEGFAKSLRNKNVVGVEMELFTFCLNNFPYIEWKSIVLPVTIFALQDTSRSSYFARWWLPQILRKFPIFVELLNKNIFENKHSHSKVLVASLKTCCLRKIPLEATNREENEFIHYLKCLFSLGEDVRGEVFSLLCQLRDQSVLHSELELSTIFSFLKYNVNANCALLRQMMLSSFSKFILRLICSSVRVIKKQPTEAESKINHVMIFLRDLNDFIADGMQPGCSYQRKIASLNLLKIIMTYAVHECESSIHRNNLKDADKFVNFVKEKGSWKFDSNKNRKLLFNCLMDSCDEVQHLAAVLLRSYFLLDQDARRIFEDAVLVSNDNKFYKRSSGYRAVVSCIAMAYKSFENPGQRFGIETSFRQHFLESLEKKIEITEKDILNAAVNFPWDSEVRILNFLMNNPQSQEFDQVSLQEVDKLISLLERIVPVLLKALFVDKSADYAPSFEESDLALRMLIKNSVISKSFRGDEEERCQLQPLNQLLLNFIWITLKVCSDLESTLVVNRTSMMTETQVIRCCNLIASKLKLCRHKGLIEAAGVSLSSVVRCLTSQNLYGYWFESIISEILYMIEFKSGATISRKSAGLSIIVQNIIGNDKRSDKPLIARCWIEFKRILNVDYNSFNNADVFQELPQTHALHLLKVIVADARNSTDLLPHLEEVTNICLTTLKAPVWVIRNAALQLFGVLLLKIVGQRNPAPTVGVRCSFEEVFFTMPRILDHLILTLEQATCLSDQCIPHSDVAPVLVILAGLRLTSVIILNETVRLKVERCRILIEKLLNSDLYAVRELAAKASLNLYSPKEMLSRTTDIANNVVEYVKCKVILQGENHLHGYLLLLKKVSDVYPESDDIIKKTRVSLLESLNVSLISQTLLFDLNMVIVEIQPLDDLLDHVENVMNVVETEQYLSIGYYQWLNAIFRVLMNNHKPYEVVEKCLKRRHRGVLMALLDELLKCEVNESIFPVLLKCLEYYIEVKDDDAMNRIITTFTKLHTPHFKVSFDEVFFKKYFDVLKELNYFYFQGVNVHLLGIFVADSGHRIDDILQGIHECLDITKYNKNIRLNAAFSMMNLSSMVNGNDINMKLIWTILVDLVQDEESDIRSIGSNCFVNIFNFDIDYGPEVAMNELFNVNVVLTRLKTNEFVDLLWNRLKIVSFEQSETLDEEELNPFDQGIINCYAEEVKIVRFAGDTLIDIFKRDLNACKEYFSNSVIEEYFNSRINDVLQNYKRYCNEYLVNSNDYLLTLRCYYLLYVFKNVKYCDQNDINECAESFKKVLNF